MKSNPLDRPLTPEEVLILREDMADLWTAVNGIGTNDGPDWLGRTLQSQRDQVAITAIICAFGLVTGNPADLCDALPWLRPRDVDECFEYGLREIRSWYEKNRPESIPTPGQQKKRMRPKKKLACF